MTGLAPGVRTASGRERSRDRRRWRTGPAAGPDFGCVRDLKGARAVRPWADRSESGARRCPARRDTPGCIALQDVLSPEVKADRKTHPKQSLSEAPSRFVRTLGFVWRLFFAVVRPPKFFYERRRRRFRALFFLVLGVALTLAVQAALARQGFCPQ